MMPKMSVRPIPSSAYVPPSTVAFIRCWKNWSIKQFSPRLRGEGGGGKLASSRSAAVRGRLPPPCPPPQAGEEEAPSVLHHFPVLQVDDVDVGDVLPALLSLGPFLDEGDVAVDAVDLGLPERLADRLGLGLAGALDRVDDGEDGVIAAESLGRAGELVPRLLPRLDIGLGE